MATIFIVEDNVGLLKSLERLLVSEGHSVTGFPNAAIALQRIRKEKVDIVVSDLFMPEMDGLELLMELQRLASWRPRVIVISGGSERFGMSALGDAKTLGADVILRKPFSKDDLLEAIEGLGSLERPSARASEDT